MISRIFRPIKEGFLGVFRHGDTAISTMTTVTLTLSIIALFMIFTMNVRQFTQKLEEGVLKIAVTVNYDYEAAEQEDRIALEIQNIEGVQKVNFSSKEEEFQYYIDQFESEKAKEAFEPFRGDRNPMHDAFYVDVESGVDIEKIASTIETIEGVEDVQFGGSSAVKLIEGMASIRNIGGGIAILLSLLSIFLIQDMIKVTIQARAQEIQIMRNVGAKNGFIRAPFLIEGLLIGAFGAIIPIVLVYFGYRRLYESTGGTLIADMLQLIPPEPFVYQMALGLLLIGMLVGLIGSYFSVTRYLRWKR